MPTSLKIVLINNQNAEALVGPCLLISIFILFLLHFIFRQYLQNAEHKNFKLPKGGEIS